MRHPLLFWIGSMKRYLLILLIILTLFQSQKNPVLSSKPKCMDGMIVYYADEYRLMDSGGENSRSFPNAHLIEHPPVWSPDQSQITFYSFSARVLYIMDSNGENVRPLAEDVAVSSNKPVWSPDGNKIAFESYHQVYTVNVEDRSVTQLTKNEWISSPQTWLPAGLLITQNDDGQASNLAIYKFDTQQIEALTIMEEGVYDYFVTSSPHHDTVYFNSNRLSDTLQLHAVSLNTQDVRLVSELFLYGGQLSPDQTQFAFMTSINIPNILVMDAETELLTPVTTDAHHLSHENYFTPTWSPDGSQLAFESFIDGSYEIFSIDIDGENMRRLTNDNVNNTNPIWLPFLTD